LIQGLDDAARLAEEINKARDALIGYPIIMGLTDEEALLANGGAGGVAVGKEAQAADI
jgi:hypothetical protein